MKELRIVFAGLVCFLICFNGPAYAGKLRDLIIQRMQERRSGESTQANVGKNSLAAGTTEVDLNYSGRSRFYLIHVPPSYDKNKPVPLVFVIHGGGGNPSQIEKQVGFDHLSDKDGVILVYPAGSSPRFKHILLTWDTLLTNTYADTENIDDVGFLLKVLEDVSSKYNIDPKRVFSTGMSQGGIMSYRLACEASDKIAAIAPVAGALITENCHPHSQVSVLSFNGLKDSRIRYMGGPGQEHVTASVTSVPNAIKFWVDKDNLSDRPTKQDKIGNAEFKLYGPNSYGTQVGLWTLKNQGHAWPGEESPRPQADRPDMDISATNLIWEFFKHHPKP